MFTKIEKNIYIYHALDGSLIHCHNNGRYLSFECHTKYAREPFIRMNLTNNASVQDNDHIVAFYEYKCCIPGDIIVGDGLWPELVENSHKEIDKIIECLNIGCKRFIDITTI